MWFLRWEHIEKKENEIGPNMERGIRKQLETANFLTYYRELRKLFSKNSKFSVQNCALFENQNVGVNRVRHIFFADFIFLLQLLVFHSGAWSGNCVVAVVVVPLFLFLVLSTSNRKLALQRSHILKSKQSSSRFSLIIYSEPSFVGSKYN